MTESLSLHQNIPIVQRIRQIGTACVWLACFFTPLSTSLLGLFSILALLCWLLSGSFLTLLADCRRHPPLSFALLLFLLMAAAISYSPAPLPDALEVLKKYRELFLLPVVYALLSGSVAAARRAENCFIAGCLLLMFSSYAMALGMIPSERYGHSVVFHITHSFFMAVLAFWAVHRAHVASRWQLIWVAIFLAATINLFYVAPGRTGMLVFIFLMALYCCQRFTVVKTMIGIGLICGVITLVYVTSDNFSGRVQQVIQEIESYKPGRARTSIGQRFDWWYVSLQLIKKQPVFGHGTGSYAIVHRQETKKTKIKRTDNPHNEFLFITVQFGLFGFSLFTALMATQILASVRMEPPRGWLLQGVLTALLIGSLMNSLLFDSHQGHFYLFMSAALMAGSGNAIEGLPAEPG